MDNRDYQSGEGDDAEHRAGRVSAPSGSLAWPEPLSYPIWHAYSRGDGYTYVYTIEYSDAQPYTVTDTKRYAIAI